MRKIPRSLLALASLPLLCACQAAFFQAVDSGSAAMAPASYTYAADRGLQLDVYRPAGANAPVPVVLFFYGGSWRTGERAQYGFVGRALASRGVLAIVADYCKFPACRFPGFEEDAAQAARWTIDHAAELGGDSRRVFLMGHSAGAQIAALLATDRQYLAAHALRPDAFAGVIGVAGPYDFLPLTDPKLIEVFGAPSQWPASQPIRFVAGNEPPFLLLQGDADRIVEPRNSSAMADALRAKGDAVSFRRYAGVGHFRILAGIRFRSLATTLEDVVGFIQKTPRAGLLHLHP
ncbi:MAG TPA: alpha/beta hydrolase [Dokdonella sp.]